MRLFYKNTFFLLVSLLEFLKMSIFGAWNIYQNNDTTSLQLS